MTAGLAVTLAAAALLLFWVIGAYNRLVVLRNAIADAFTKVHDALQLRAAAVEPLVAALREPMAAEHGALDTWLAAHTDATQAAGALAARPMAEANAQAWVAAETALAAAASRVLALLDQAGDLAHSDAVAALAATWREGQARLPFARQVFNEAAAAYNDAIALFPTRIVARGFGLGRAGMI